MATIAAPDTWGKPITRDISDLIELRNMRGVSAFSEFPRGTRDVYNRVAKCFPGIQVWAVGSRVRGDYTKKLDGRWIKEARAKAGMKHKEESDYDFLVAPDAIQFGELPENTERVRCRIPESEKIPIPILKKSNK